MNLIMDYANLVTDPTDWNPTRLPVLSDLDSALRCQICKDFYTSPVITNCSHTFCSLCIRRALHAEQICPICRTAEQEYRLRKNNAVQELVDAFVQARPKLMEVATEKQDDGSNRQGQSAEDLLSSQTQSSQRSSQQRTRSQARAAAQVLESSDDEPEFKPDDGMVECPVCSRRMKEISINAHIDKCLQDQAGPSSSSPIPQSPRIRTLRSGSSRNAIPLGKSIPPECLKPLPKINYSFLKEGQLRSKLMELGIPTVGSKKLLQERHTEWMNIWNANVDSNKPRSKAELLQELSTWERAHLRPPNKPTKVPGWSDDQWAIRHSDEFSSLIAQARKKRKTEVKKDKSTTENKPDEITDTLPEQPSSTPSRQPEQISLPPLQAMLSGDYTAESDSSASQTFQYQNSDTHTVDKSISISQPSQQAILSLTPLSSDAEGVAVQQTVETASRFGDGNEAGKRKFDEMDHAPSVGAS